MLILVVEDDEDYAQMITHVLQRDSHDVIVATTAVAAVRAIAQREPDVAIVDVVLPDHSGHEVCKLLRAQVPAMPIMFLSSLDRPSDVIEALNLGGDDYLTKPFHPGELVARVRSLTRRSATTQTRKHDKVTEPEITLEPFEIDVANQVAYLNGVDLNCTRIEVELLALLAHHPGQVLSHAFLSERIWGYDNVGDATLLKGHVSSLRRKIRTIGDDDDLIRTVHGVGYGLDVSRTPVS